MNEGLGQTHRGRLQVTLMLYISYSRTLIDRQFQADDSLKDYTGEESHYRGGHSGRGGHGGRG